MIHDKLGTTKKKIYLLSISKYIITVVLLSVSQFNFCQQLNVAKADELRTLNFKNISVNDGLSQYAVTSLMQDSDGFMWIGTYDGLNRYDGFNLESFRRIYNDTTSLMNNRILSLAVKSENELWIGTQDGLIVYNKHTQKFRSLPNATKSLSTKRIDELFIDSDGNLWIGTERGLVIGYKSKNNNDAFTFVAHKCCNEMSITNFCEDETGSVWMATNIGAYIVTKLFYEISIQQLKGTLNLNLWVTYKDKQNRIWVGGDNYLSIITRTSNEFSIKRLDKQIFNNSLLNIRAFVEDTVNSCFWIGTWRHALINIQLNQDNDIKFKNEFNDDVDYGGISDNDIGRLYIDKSNILWVGTRNGVSFTDLSPKKFHSLELFDKIIGDKSIKRNYINSLFSDSNNKLWINIYLMGLYVYDLSHKTIVNVSHRVTSNSIMEIFESETGDLWFGALDGIYRLRKQYRNINNVKAEKINPGIIKEPQKFSAMLLEDKYGSVWFPVNNSIIRYFPDKDTFVEYSVKDGLPPTTDFYQIFYTPDSNFIWINAVHSGIYKIHFNNSNEQIKTESFASNTNMANRFVWQLFVDKNNVMWIGTDTGLDKIDMNRETKTVEHFNNPVIRNSKVSFIATDNSDNLWMGSSQGLYCIDTKTNEVQKYTHEDGLQSNSFTDAITVNKEGIMYTGSINGISYFNPNVIIKNRYQSKTVFLKLKINNKEVSIDEVTEKRVVLTKDINFVNKIELNYRQNNFTIEFAALHFASPNRNRYKFKLDGYDPDWVEVDGNHRFASYSNLPSGTYKFKLLTSNNDHIWADAPKVLTVSILPPPWKTVWAYLFYTLIIGLILYFILKYINEKQSWKNKLIVQQLEKQKEHELNEMKLSFFTNITHELRTPLVLIMGPLRDLLNWGGLKEEFISFRLNIIDRNANKLLNLINQILNVRSMSSNHLPLSVKKKDIVKLVQETTQSFTNYAERKNINLQFDVKNDNYANAWFDQDKIEKILHNLISNAIKFTPNNGSIFVNMTLEYKEFRMVNISVTDTGSGIDPTLLPHIFDLYSKGTMDKEFSSGIGLCFSKLLIEAHQGSIEVESELDKGSVFSILFPIDKECFSAESIISINQEEESEVQAIVDVPISKETKSKILIVEDNNDMRKYIKECLRNDFDIVEAKDGVEGLAIAKKILPNAIITDLMMPGIDGATLLDSIRKDARTNFIPIVVHSVLDDKETINKLLSKGANEYIVKPFEAEVLIYKINSLLKIQVDFAKKIHNETLLKPEEVEVESLDDKLLKKISKIIEENIQNQNLDADFVSSIIGMSRMQLYRRLKQISGGKQLSEIILSMRLERAAQLLATGEKRISEVMDEAGFNNNTRFKNHFVNAFGVSPSDYIKKNIDKQ